MTKLAWCRRPAILALLISMFAGAVRAEIPSRPPLPPAARTPEVQPPLLFPRIRTIYNLYRNPYQNFYAIDWLDRPLLHDSSLYTLPADARELENNIRQLDLAMSYGANGLSMLYHGPEHFHRFQKLIEAAEINFPKNGNLILISLLGHILREGPEKAADQFEPVLRRLLQSPAAARINGKVVIGSYRTDYIPPEKLARFLHVLHERCGDRFSFVATIAELKGQKLSNYIHLSRAFEAGHGTLPAPEIEAAQAYLRRYLQVSDGLLMNGVNHIDSVDNGFQADFYDRFVCRIFSSVMAEPAGRGKLLGLSASLGYVNHIAGGHQLENGTRTLRDSLTSAYAAHPDFIIMPEWNELNENTCLEPGVTRSYSSRRIIRYFTQKARGQLSPLPDDVTAVPNLIVSQRAVLKWGDSFYLELLNVPDRPEARRYRVICTLRDAHDQVIKRFPPVEFDAAQLQEHRFTLTPQEVAAHRAIKAELTIETASGNEMKVSDGLPFTRIQSTWNTNYICLKQPLRDMAGLERFQVEFTPQPDGDVRFRVAAEAGKDKIRNLEILEDDTVVYAYDPAGRLTPGPNDLLLHFYYSSIREIKPFPIRLSVTGGKILMFQDRLRLGDAREEKWQIRPEITMNWKSNRNRRGALLLISNRQNAVLTIKTPLGSEKIKLSELEKRRRIVHTGNGTVTLGVETADRAPDLPAPTNATGADFTATLRPLNPTSAYRVRLITMSGRSFTKGPYLLPRQPDGVKTTFRVFDSDRLTPITLAADRSNAPELYYSAARLSGSIVPGAPGRRCDATLGGGAEYGGVFSTPQSYPAQAGNPAPKVVQDGAERVFEFDGVGNYLHFPAEAIPSSSAFTLEFEFKPFSLKNQTLFACRQEYEGMLEIGMVNGKIQCTFRGRLKPGEKPYYRKASLSSPAPLKAGQWNRLKLVYDLSQIRLTVNDAPPVAVAWNRISWWMFNAASFGGWGKDDKTYFHGQLKALRIRHYAAPQP